LIEDRIVQKKKVLYLLFIFNKEKNVEKSLDNINWKKIKFFWSAKKK